MGDPVINDGSASTLHLWFRDNAGADDAPASARYRIDCETNDSVVTDWTAIGTPTATDTVAITSAENTIISDSNDREKRVVTVEGTDSGGEKVTEQFTYYVRNLANY